jgi:serpin B
MRHFTVLLAAALVAGGCTRDKIIDTDPSSPAGVAKDATVAGPTATGTLSNDDPSSLNALTPDPITKPPFPAAPVSDVAKVVAGNGAFAVDLYRQLAKDPGNLFFSPSSISTALAMTYAGARADTAKQMEKTLRFPFTDAKLHTAYGQLLADLQATDAKGPDFRVANRLFGQQSYAFDKAFLDLETTRYGAPLQLVDFGQTEASRLTINKWVSVQTHDKIPELLAKGVLDDSTRLVLTNAVYFKGAWRDQFDESLTKDAPFSAFGTTKNVPTMHQTLDASYFETKDAQIVDLPYQSSDPSRVFTMTIVLPKPGVDLAQLEAQYDQLDTWTAAMKLAQIDLSLPKFKTTSKFELGDTLTKMGMPNAFDSTTADFSGMTKTERLWIAHVVHQAFIATDENGTEAAAATAVVMDGESAAPQLPTHVFNADHPFSVMIRDRKTGTLLFMGRIVDPVS